MGREWSRMERKRPAYLTHTHTHAHSHWQDDGRTSSMILSQIIQIPETPSPFMSVRGLHMHMENIMIVSWCSPKDKQILSNWISSSVLHLNLFFLVIYPTRLVLKYTVIFRTFLSFRTTVEISHISQLKTKTASQRRSNCSRLPNIVLFRWQTNQQKKRPPTYEGGRGPHNLIHNKDEPWLHSPPSPVLNRLGAVPRASWGKHSFTHTLI